MRREYRSVGGGERRRLRRARGRAGCGKGRHSGPSGGRGCRQRDRRRSDRRADRGGVGLGGGVKEGWRCLRTGAERQNAGPAQRGDDEGDVQRPPVERRAVRAHADPAWRRSVVTVISRLSPARRSDHALTSSEPHAVDAQARDSRLFIASPRGHRQQQKVRMARLGRAVQADRRKRGRMPRAIAPNGSTGTDQLMAGDGGAWNRRGGGGNRTRVQGFAGPCLSHSATPPGEVSRLT